MKVVELKNEFDSIECLQSPGIVKLFAFIRDDQNAKLIIKMEYLEGGSLLDKIKPYNPSDKYSRCKPLNETLSLNYMEQLMNAVVYLHSLKIYHGDIKPTNILFTSTDQLKLCDIGFGVHLQFASSANQAHMRKNCYYMSPERVGGESRSAANDIWSIGATFVKMVTGQTVNHKDKFPTVNMNIASYNITIDELPLKQYLLPITDESDYKKLIISQTLVALNNRVNAETLLATVQLCKGRLPTAGHNAVEVQDSNFNQ
jgi:serine/threonine protein kinase